MGWAELDFLKAGLRVVCVDNRPDMLSVDGLRNQFRLPAVDDLKLLDELSGIFSDSICHV